MEGKGVINPNGAIEVIKEGDIVRVFNDGGAISGVEISSSVRFV